MGSKANEINQIGSAECHPEKAGVGGSIPSLATTFSITYSHRLTRVCSILFQFQIQACRDLSPEQDGSMRFPPANSLEGMPPEKTCRANA